MSAETGFNSADATRINSAVWFYEERFKGLKDFVEEEFPVDVKAEDLCKGLEMIHNSIWKVINKASSDPSIIKALNERISSLFPPDEIKKTISDVKYLKLVLDWFTDSIKKEKDEKLISNECKEKFSGLGKITRSRARTRPVPETEPVEIKPPVEEKPAKEVEITAALREKFRQIFDTALSEVMKDPATHCIRKIWPTRYLHDRFFSNAQRRSVKFAVEDFKKFISTNLDNEPYRKAMQEFFALLQ